MVWHIAAWIWVIYAFVVHTFKELFSVYCTVFSQISLKCRNSCNLRAYFTKWEKSCNIVWLSYQNPKYRVISCGPKKDIVQGWSWTGIETNFVWNWIELIFLCLGRTLCCMTCGAMGLQTSGRLPRPSLNRKWWHWISFGVSCLLCNAEM